MDEHVDIVFIFLFHVLFIMDLGHICPETFGGVYEWESREMKEKRKRSEKRRRRRQRLEDEEENTGVNRRRAFRSWPSSFPRSRRGTHTPWRTRLGSWAQRSPVPTTPCHGTFRDTPAGFQSHPAEGTETETERDRRWAMSRIVPCTVHHFVVQSKIKCCYWV